MPAKSLLDVPPEIRERIYIHALSSPTGYITPVPKGNVNSAGRSAAYRLATFELPSTNFEPPREVGGDDVAFPLLQTCKRIYAEAKHLVYQHNTLAFICDSWVSPRYLQPRICEHVQRIWIGVDLTVPDELEEMSRTFNLIHRWAEGGVPLRTYTLAVAADFYTLRILVLSREMDGPCNQLGQTFAEYMEILRTEREMHNDSAVDGVHRRLELRTDFFHAHQMDPGNTIEDFHEAFGGEELWVGDKLCYKHGAEILRPFARCRDGWQLAWFQEDDDVYWGRALPQSAPPSP